jgi:hypothetical protein
MIPPKIIRFLERANVAHAGTRDARLVPHGHRVSGWRAGADVATLVVLVSESSRGHLIESLEDNGEFSATIEEYPAHEAYQFKGSYVRHWAAGADEMAIADRVRERFLRAVLPLFGEEAERPVRAFIQRPAVAVEFRVREIYVQTPGPGAGALLSPAEP